MVLEILTKYLLNALAIFSGLVDVILFILFPITIEGTEFEILFRDISFLIPFQMFI